MGTRNFVEELEYSDASGLDTTSPLPLVGPGFVREAWNTNLGLTSGYYKRQGFTRQLTTAWMGSIFNMSIRQGFEFRVADGTVQKIFYGTDNATDGRLGRQSGTSIVDIVTGLSATERLSFVQVDDRLFGFNGDSSVTPFVYEGGSSVRTPGIAGPAAMPTLTAAAGGALNEGVYLFAYTYAIRNTVTGQILAESNPSDLAEIELTTGQDRVQVGVVASGVVLSGSNDVRIRIWRTVTGGSVLFLETDIADTTTTYNSDTADAGLQSTQLVVDGSRLEDFEDYNKARFPVVARNRIFVGHETKLEARWSFVSQEGPRPETFQAVSYASLEGKKGAADRLVGLGQIGGIPIVLKEESVGRLEEVGLPEITQAEDPVTYLYREISDTVGAVTHHAQCQVMNELVFLSRDNVYATDGQNLRPIATTIQSTIRALDMRDSKRDKLSMVNDTKYRRIYISAYLTTTSAEPNLILVGDYQQYPKFRWTTYQPGTNNVTHPGIRAGSFFQLTNAGDGTLDVYFGSTDRKGQYYKMNDGNRDRDYATNANLGIYMRLASRPYFQSQPLVVKLFKNTRIFAELENPSYSLDICSAFELQSEEELCQVFQTDTLGNNWDEHNWVDDPETEVDPLIWGGSVLREYVYSPHRRAKFMQLIIKQTDLDAPVSILGWGVSGSISTGL